MIHIEKAYDESIFIDNNAVKLANILEDNKIIAIAYKTRFGYSIKLTSNHMEYLSISNEDAYDLYKDKLTGKRYPDDLRIESLLNLFKQKYIKEIN